jgi:hypothetical protein
MGAMLDRMIRAMARRATGGELEALGVLRELRWKIDAAIAEGAQGAHDAFGYSWTEIGNELGVTRQAARQMYGRPDRKAAQ